MGSFEYIVSSQKRSVVKVVADGSGASFSLTGPAWGGTAYTYSVGVQNDGAEWTLPQDKDVALASVFYGLSGAAASLDYSSGTKAFVIPANSDGHICFERCAIPNTSGGTGSTGTFSVTTAATGIVILEFVR